MLRVSPDAEPPCDIWSYFEKIPANDFDGHDCSAGNVNYVWNDSSGRYQHVLIDSKDENVSMVIVIDLVHSTVFGHRILNLSREYGIDFT